MTTETSLYRTTQAVWYVFYVLETLLFLRFVLMFLGANPGAAFTELVYGITAIPLAPFRLVFEANAVAGSVVEWSTLLAMLVYWFLAWGIVKLITMGRPLDHREAERGLEMQDKA